MKTLDFISDIHGDFYNLKTQPKIEKFVKDKLKPKDSSTLVIAGDLGHYNKMDLGVLKELRKYYEHIVLVTGNHDMYLISKSQRHKYENSSKARVADMKQLCASETGIYYLDGGVIDIDGVTIGGVGYWYDSPVDQWRNVMNDSRMIMECMPFSIPRPYGSPYVETGFDTKAYYLKEKEKLKAMPKVDVLVTHVCPSKLDPYQMPRQYLNDANNIFYENNDTDLVSAKLCIFGHTHDLYDFEDQGTRYVANPFGYPSENSGREIRTIDIP